MKTLRDVKIGETVTVVKLHGEGAVKRRIMDMGLLDLNVEIIQSTDRSITSQEVVRTRTEADDLQVLQTNDSTCDGLSQPTRAVRISTRHSTRARSAYRHIPCTM